MKKYELKMIDNKLLIDMGNNKNDDMTTYGYDGLPNVYDTCDIDPAKIVGTVELSQEQIEAIQNEYKNGDKCDWCGEGSKKLSDPHLFEYIPNAKMCRNCWEKSRKNYLGVTGYDIGPFGGEKESNDGN
ncbi:hypothetical protein P4U07_30815 [Bacillus mycoides]|uniref:hypothetical protein n=1 Tax=Bacillus mycoides TaxID=1405 RepID=UPI002E23E6B6|nr:hypothetical protein [Bacillus mycoides]